MLLDPIHERFGYDPVLEQIHLDGCTIKGEGIWDTLGYYVPTPRKRFVHLCYKEIEDYSQTLCGKLGKEFN